VVIQSIEGDTGTADGKLSQWGGRAEGTFRVSESSSSGFYAANRASKRSARRAYGRRPKFRLYYRVHR